MATDSEFVGFFLGELVVRNVFVEWVLEGVAEDLLADFEGEREEVGWRWWVGHFYWEMGDGDDACYFAAILHPEACHAIRT